MSAKRHLNKKAPGRKKIISSVAKANRSDAPVSVQRGSEEAIVRQFRRIKKGYSIFMTEVVKEYGLIKDWIEKEASTRTEVLKEKLSSRFRHI